MWIILGFWGLYYFGSFFFCVLIGDRGVILGYEREFSLGFGISDYRRKECVFLKLEEFGGI